MCVFHFATFIHYVCISEIAFFLQVASKGVRVNSVNPGVIVTDIFEKSGLTKEQAEDYMEISKSLHPLGRPGTVQEVAAAIAFLASEVLTLLLSVHSALVLLTLLMSSSLCSCPPHFALVLLTLLLSSSLCSCSPHSTLVLFTLHLSSSLCSCFPHSALVFLTQLFSSSL